MSKLITVFGATGNQGGSVIRTILNDAKLSKEFRIRAVTRDVNKPTALDLTGQGVEVVMGDMSSPEDMSTVISGSHSVFLVTNFWESQSAAPEIIQGKIVTDACKAAGVKHLIFSSLIDAAEATHGRLIHITHFDGKAEVERYIESSGLPATFVMLGIFTTQLFGLIRKQDDGTFVLATPTNTNAAAPFIDVNADTGNFVRAAILNQPETGTKTIHASSQYYTFDEIAAHFRSATGNPINVFSVPGELFKSFLTPSLSPDMAEEVYENLMLLEDPGYYAGADLTPSLNLLSERPMGLEEFFRRNKAQW
ncbi:hypothetical protein N7478_005428 [Penicillium angulare]|uniref:uncharacterized protein n=1 Tax=Penicillium angulare TaxID=116970 RepID=UPI002541E987|nr:uncharacterized protein N7478_005428 [Penicillium angulare]KAJ5280056.1 hypothetical protein N7478_005428 [Penicillium angulare]